MGKTIKTDGAIITKDKDGDIISKDASSGGLLIGKKHSDSGDGIKAIVKEDNRPILIESGEVVITAPAVKKHWRQLDEINQDGGGVPIKAPQSVKMKRGGKVSKWQKLSAYTIAKNCSDLSDVEAGIQELKDYFKRCESEKKKPTDTSYIRFSKLHDKKKEFELKEDLKIKANQMLNHKGKPIKVEKDTSSQLLESSAKASTYNIESANINKKTIESAQLGKSIESYGITTLEQLLSIEKEIAIKFIVEVLKNDVDNFYIEIVEKGRTFDLVADAVILFCKTLILPYGRKNAVRTKFGDYVFFEPDADLIQREILTYKNAGVLVAQIKYAAHQATTGTQYKNNNGWDRRAYDKSKKDNFHIIVSGSFSPDERFVNNIVDGLDLENENKGRNKIYYTKKIEDKRLGLLVFEATIENDGRIKYISIMPNKNEAYIVKNSTTIGEKKKETMFAPASSLLQLSSSTPQNGIDTPENPLEKHNTTISNDDTKVDKNSDTTKQNDKFFSLGGNLEDKIVLIEPYFANEEEEKEDLLQMENNSMFGKGGNISTLMTLPEFLNSAKIQEDTKGDTMKNRRNAVDKNTGEFLAFGYFSPIWFKENGNDEKKMLTAIYDTAVKVAKSEGAEVKVSENKVAQETDSEIMAKYPKPTKQQVHAIFDKVSEILQQKTFSDEDKYILEQYEGLGSQTQTGIIDKGLLHQFYTPYIIIKKMYDLAEHYGFKGGNVLEPSSGTGRFFKYAPKGSNLIGFDPDKKNIEIAKILYPSATLYEMPFETAFLQAPRFNKMLNKSWLPEIDLAIGNPPYGDYMGYYKSYMPSVFKRFEFLFVYLCLKVLKKDGLLIFIVSQNFMNNGVMYNGMKKEILKLATFVDAIRLPNGIFSSTEVGTDLIVLQRN